MPVWDNLQQYNGLVHQQPHNVIHWSGNTPGCNWAGLIMVGRQSICGSENEKEQCLYRHAISSSSYHVLVCKACLPNFMHVIQQWLPHRDTRKARAGTVVWELGENREMRQRRVMWPIAHTAHSLGMPASCPIETEREQCPCRVNMCALIRCVWESPWHASHVCHNV